jgi:non-specific protein-tyrosine kinase
LDIKDFYRLLLRNLWPLLVFITVTVSLAAIITASIPKEYKATAQLFVSTPPATLDIGQLATGSNFTESRVKSYANIINGPATLLPVIGELNLDTSWNRLAKKIKASAPLDTALINLTVVDDSPLLAAKIANAVGKQFEGTVANLEVKTETGASPVKVTLVKTAIPPNTPSSPRWELNLLIGLLIGFGLGVTFGIVRSIFDQSIKNEDQLGDLKLVGAIGFDPKVKDKPVIAHDDLHDPRAESFRQLRTNILFSKELSQSKVIMISSPLPGEGKTSTVLNLGVSLAEAGYKVLCIEADLRRPSFIKYLDIEESKLQLESMLIEQKTLDVKDMYNRLIQFDPTSKLHVIASKRPAKNPSVLFDGPYFEKTISMLRGEFDFILIDTPPLLPVSDAVTISSSADCVLLVLKTAQTKTYQFEGARDNLTNVGANILGVVLNMVPIHRNGETYGYKYGYSNQYKRRYSTYSSGDYGQYVSTANED